MTGTRPGLPQRVALPSSQMWSSVPLPLSSSPDVAGSPQGRQQNSMDWGQNIVGMSFSRSSFYDVLMFCLLWLLLFYRGKTRKPEKVEYCHPPTRLPFSSFRYTLSSFSSSSRTPFVAASRVTSLSPAKAEMTGLPFSIRLTWRNPNIDTG